MMVQPITALSDNYIWVMEEGSRAVVVDPGESAKVLGYLKENELTLEAILLTHEHDDHIGGVKAVLADYPDAPVYGPKETKPLNTETVEDGDTFEVLDQTVQVFKTAGHSTEHISFLIGSALFSGDALFSGGCGRVFTGDYQAQYDALQVFNQLDEGVSVYAGHEYTLTNLRFAQSIDKENESIAEELEQVKALREREMPTLPSTIGKEKRINLFLKADSVEAFTDLRNQRDDFS
ncbi:hydroxyacylglutathione hydrolase [Marinilactibacillus kalidii]|uniref:hydroxyacylglutathione hydrolase n=1 Tax=Marinilactibacillus kalidii TaxID=2820274 RepID=UPI001ABEB65B|nr:hydroxyacylglutathione hydrolase [Marinilactibacillus kalidii]